jgi:8-oxo-dGTP diphosphatase
VNEPTPPLVRPRVAAGVLFLNENERVLLVVPSYKDYLDIPGGYVEPGESPSAAAAARSTRSWASTDLSDDSWSPDWWHHSPEDPGDPKLLFVFDGGCLPPTQLDHITVDGTEVTGFKFHALPDPTSVTIPRLANRIQHAVAAGRGETIRYLEDGQPMTRSMPA